MRPGHPSPLNDGDLSPEAFWRPRGGAAELARIASAPNVEFLTPIPTAVSLCGPLCRCIWWPNTNNRPASKPRSRPEHTHGLRVFGPCWARTRLATSICQLRHQMEQGPTEAHTGCGTFLLSFGGAGGAVAFDAGPIPTENQFPWQTLVACLACTTLPTQPHGPSIFINSTPRPFHTPSGVGSSGLGAFRRLPRPRATVPRNSGPRGCPQRHPKRRPAPRAQEPLDEGAGPWQRGICVRDSPKG